MGDSLNQALVYTATSNTAIRTSGATPIIAKSNTNIERRYGKKNISIQFLSKPMFEISSSYSLYINSCD